LSEDSNRQKTKLLLLSGVTLFIAVTESFPTKIAMLGLEFPDNGTRIGWFLVALVIYFLLVFLIYSYLELSKYLLPYKIRRNTANTTSELIGLSEEEILAEDHMSDEPDGSMSGEWKSIQNQKSIKKKEIEKRELRLHNRIVISLEVVVPALFSSACVVMMIRFLFELKSIP